jgi:hypothetical protein
MCNDCDNLSMHILGMWLHNSRQSFVFVTLCSSPAPMLQEYLAVCSCEGVYFF